MGTCSPPNDQRDANATKVRGTQVQKNRYVGYFLTMQASHPKKLFDKALGAHQLSSTVHNIHWRRDA